VLPRTFCRLAAATLYGLFSFAAMATGLCQNTSTAPNAATASYVPHLSFDVISVRERRDGNMSFYDNPTDSSYFHAEYGTVVGLILTSYQIKTFQQLEHVPDWAMSVRYDVTAKSDGATDEALAKLSKEDAQAEKRHMLRQVLVDRFKLRIHEETRTSTVYDLVATTRTASAMTRVTTSPAKTIGTCAGKFSQQGRDIDSRGCPFKILLNTIEQQFGTTINNKSGFLPEDWYSYHLTYDPRSIPRPDVESFPQLRNALHDQLGLDLKERKGPVVYWVVDDVARPTPN